MTTIARITLAAVFLCATAWADTAPSTVICKDGSTSKGGRGACRGHGGVDKEKSAATSTAPSAAAPAPTPPSRAATPSPSRAEAPATSSGKATSGTKAASSDPSGALARCKDGMYWHGTKHSGSCSHHGGVEQWLDGSESKR
jgi:hypothetical protein